MMNNRGQMSIIIGLVVAVIAIIFLSAFTPVIVDMFGIQKGNSGLNCVGYIDSYATTALGGGNNQSYDSAKNTDRTACSFVAFGPALIILAVIFGLVAGLITGTLGKSAMQEQSQYGGQGYSQQY